jgi:hypothetical protein
VENAHSENREGNVMEALRWALVRQVVRIGGRTGSGSCPVAGFGISGVQTWVSAVIVLLLFCRYYHVSYLSGNENYQN